MADRSELQVPVQMFMDSLEQLLRRGTFSDDSEIFNYVTDFLNVFVTEKVGLFRVEGAGGDWDVHTLSSEPDFPHGTIRVSDFRQVRNKRRVAPGEFANAKLRDAFEDFGFETVYIYNVSPEQRIEAMLGVSDILGTNESDELRRVKKIAIRTTNYVLRNRFSQESLEDAAMTDTLTGLNERRFLDQGRITKELAEHEPGYCLMLDVDHFKQVNDRFGHSTGDRVLRKLSDLIKKRVTEKDHAIRYGGEEFAVFLPERSEEQAIEWSEGLRQAVEDESPEWESNKNLEITVSIGLAAYDPDDDVSVALEEADQRLYDAKESGRNKVVYD